MTKFLAGCFLAAVVVLAQSPVIGDELSADDGETRIGLTGEKLYLHVMHEGKAVKVQRIQDSDYQLQGYFAKAGRACPPFCIRPLAVSEGVETVAELEIFNFMENQLRDGSGLLIDARTPQWYRRGTIPGSVNIPFVVLTGDADDEQLAAALQLCGAKPRGDVGYVRRQMEEWGMFEKGQKTDRWDFTEAKELVLWCNGPTCGQSPRAIKGLLDLGYPVDKLKYYRGGMQLWQLWGLTTVIPKT